MLKHHDSPILLLACLVLTACGTDVERPNSAPVGEAVYPVVTHVPDRLHGLQTTTEDSLGNPVSVACATCHEGRETRDVRGPDELEEFHTGMTLEHGTLACASCHNPDDKSSLRLADGTSVRMPDAMTLCAQCHGPQSRDYDRGSHGGMSGHWDLSRGPRERNNCVDCHDPHAPEFPQYLPMPAPNDRFLEPHGGDHK